MNRSLLRTGKALVILSLFAVVAVVAVAVPAFYPHAGAIFQIVLYFALVSFTAFQLYVCTKLAKRIGRSGAMVFTTLWLVLGVMNVILHLMDLHAWPSHNIVTGDVYTLLALNSALMVIDSLMRSAIPVQSTTEVQMTKIG